MTVPINIKVKKTSRIRQGDIYKDIELIEYIKERKGDLEISKILFPYIIVLTQECDLEQDFYNRKPLTRKGEPQKDQDKQLMSVLVAPFFNVEQFKVGKHFEDIELKMNKDIKWDRTEGTKIRNNEIPRYHYLEFPGNVSIPLSIIDFKHFFSVNIMELNKIRSKNFICSVSQLFREEISQRFAYYLSRIGLPEPKKKEK